jgi:hypothetical protein
VSSPSARRYLLDDLCARLGLCLPADERARILSLVTDDPAAFVDEVLRAEGLAPGDHAGLAGQAQRMAHDAFARERGL